MDHKLVMAEGRILAAWISFRETHDIQKAEMQCCSRTRELFEALQAFEDLITTKGRDEKVNDL